MFITEGGEQSPDLSDGRSKVDIDEVETEGSDSDAHSGGPSPHAMADAPPMGLALPLPLPFAGMSDGRVMTPGSPHARSLRHVELTFDDDPLGLEPRPHADGAAAPPGNPLDRLSGAMPLPGGQGCIRREGASEAAPDAV